MALQCPHFPIVLYCNSCGSTADVYSQKEALHMPFLCKVCKLTSHTFRMPYHCTMCKMKMPHHTCVYCKQLQCEKCCTNPRTCTKCREYYNSCRKCATAHNDDSSSSDIKFYRKQDSRDSYQPPTRDGDRSSSNIKSYHKQDPRDSYQPPTQDGDRSSSDTKAYRKQDPRDSYQTPTRDGAKPFLVTKFSSRQYPRDSYQQSGRNYWNDRSTATSYRNAFYYAPRYTRPRPYPIDTRHASLYPRSAIQVANAYQRQSSNSRDRCYQDKESLNKCLKSQMLLPSQTYTTSSSTSTSPIKTQVDSLVITPHADVYDVQTPNDAPALLTPIDAYDVQTPNDAPALLTPVDAYVASPPSDAHAMSTPVGAYAALLPADDDDIYAMLQSPDTSSSPSLSLPQTTYVTSIEHSNTQPICQKESGEYSDTDDETRLIDFIMKKFE